MAIKTLEDFHEAKSAKSINNIVTSVFYTSSKADQQTQQANPNPALSTFAYYKF